mmetsp:Transcript_34959/g.69035  ORF Transcript_34959/g.69035 Transcript_34959/m.69035 type:complete len:93 (-) Transcript_34959:27-305(-)
MPRGVIVGFKVSHAKKNPHHSCLMAQVILLLAQVILPQAVVRPGSYFALDTIAHLRTTASHAKTAFMDIACSNSYQVEHWDWNVACCLSLKR